MNFCTLFDSNYLTRALAMYESLRATCADFHLYIFAFDDKAFEIFKKLSLEKITLISLKEFENEKMLAVKPSRSRAEYCWTCTPFTIDFVLSNFPVNDCTYIDADLFFYSSPKVLLDEMGGNSVLITEHRYTPKYDRSEIAGKYCVQFINFKKNDDGLKVLHWWRDACLNWCYDRYEDGKFGDQKYLDDWTSRFSGVHVLEHMGGGLAPWNIQQYKLATHADGKIDFKTRNGGKRFKAVFYHFHYVRFYQHGLVDLGWFSLEKEIIKKIYSPYILSLARAEELLKKADSSFMEAERPFSLAGAGNFKDKMKILAKLISRYNLFYKDQFLKN